LIFPNRPINIERILKGRLRSKEFTRFKIQTRRVTEHLRHRLVLVSQHLSGNLDGQPQIFKRIFEFVLKTRIYWKRCGLQMIRLSDDDNLVPGGTSLPLLRIASCAADKRDIMHGGKKDGSSIVRLGRQNG
jgi:hypothetical protein